MALNIRGVIMLFRPLADMVEQNQYIGFKLYLKNMLKTGDPDIYKHYGEFYGVNRIDGKQQFLIKFLDDTNTNGYQIYRVTYDPDSDTIQMILVPVMNMNSNGEVI